MINLIIIGCFLSLVPMVFLHMFASCFKDDGKWIEELHCGEKCNG
jgi:hypothetical protein